jgi:hypothetical protein
MTEELEHALAADTPLAVARRGLQDLDRLLHQAVQIIKRRVDDGTATTTETLLVSDYYDVMTLLQCEQIAIASGMEDVRTEMVPSED